VRGLNRLTTPSRIGSLRRDCLATLWREREPYYTFAQKFQRARGGNGLRILGTLFDIGRGGEYLRPRKKVYVDNSGRRWETDEVETEWQLEKDAEGNVIPLLDESGKPVLDPTTKLPMYKPLIDTRTGKPLEQAVMVRSSREPDSNTLKWLAERSHATEDFHQEEKGININLTAQATDPMVLEMATASRNYREARRLEAPTGAVLIPEVVDDEDDEKDVNDAF
jgi:hypothetical protein